jgi:ubiquinone/menaquinone biosynthesis C-methylase UbiE
MAAQRLPRGRAVGIDVWSAKDQSGNAEQVTRQNADLEGVADRVELHTADMRQLPFEDGSFDVVVSSLAIHNISGAGERAKALHEAARDTAALLLQDNAPALLQLNNQSVALLGQSLPPSDQLLSSILSDLSASNLPSLIGLELGLSIANSVNGTTP